MKNNYSTIAYTTLSLLLILCLSLAPVKAQAQTSPDNMPKPQEMMMRQMALRAHQYQGNSNQEKLKDSPHKIQNPRNSMMGMMGQNRPQMRNMMMSSNMGPGMMQGNMMAYPMMGFANGQELEDMTAYEEFVNKTRELRRSLNNKRFDFKEAFWIPETTLQELRDMAKEINSLQQEINAKMPPPETAKN